MIIDSNYQSQTTSFATNKTASTPVSTLVDSTTKARNTALSSVVDNDNSQAATYKISEDAKNYTNNKLTKDQLSQMQNAQKQTELAMLESMLSKDPKNSSQKALKDLLTKTFGSLEAMYPSVGNTPQEAAAAIGEGGDYSVEAVSDRLIKMATALAGGDETKLATLRKAIDKGFESAGMDLETGKGMPPITYETYKATMSKFDELEKSLSKTTN